MNKSNKVNEVQHRSIPPTSLRGSADEPWLVFFHGKQTEFQTFYRISEGGEYHFKKIPRLRHKKLCASSHGWMVLMDLKSKACFLLNPTTMDEIQLPPINFYYTKCLLLSSPSHPNSFVLFISNSRDGVMTFRFSSPKKGVDHWIKQDVNLENRRIRDAVACGSKIYGLTSSHPDEIMIAEVVDNATSLKVQIIEIQGYEINFKGVVKEGPGHCVLVVDPSSDQVYIVRKTYREEYTPSEILDIHVYKLDISRNYALETVKGLGNCAMFLGPYLSTSFIAPVGKPGSALEGNAIYFTMVNDNSLYTYHLEGKEITASLPCPRVHRHWSQPTWVGMLPPC